MDALSEDLRALVVAKELTLKQAIELNKQKAPVEEGLDKIVNLFDDDADLERFTRSVQSDVVALRGGVQWENEFHTIYPSTTNVSCAWAQGR